MWRRCPCQLLGAEAGGWLRGIVEGFGASARWTRGWKKVASFSDASQASRRMKLQGASARVKPRLNLTNHRLRIVIIACWQGSGFNSFKTHLLSTETFLDANKFARTMLTKKGLTPTIPKGFAQSKPLFREIQDYWRSRDKKGLLPAPTSRIGEAYRCLRAM